MIVTMISLLILLSSCVTGAPRYKHFEISCDTRIYKTTDGNYNGRCLCRCLDINDLESPLVDFSNCDDRFSGDDVRLSLLSCDKLIGFRVNRYLEEISPYIKEVKNYCEDNIGKGL